MRTADRLLVGAEGMAKVAIPNGSPEEVKQMTRRMNYWAAIGRIPAVKRGRLYTIALSALQRELGLAETR